VIWVSIWNATLGMLIPKPMKGGKSSHVKVMLPGVFKVKKVAEFFLNFLS
jgi:hypothetical protein